MRLIKRPLGIGGLDDPPTFLFQYAPGPRRSRRSSRSAASASGCVVAEGEILDTDELPALEMPYGLFRPDTGVRACMDAWLRLGGPHHQVLNPGRHAADWRVFCELAGSSSHTAPAAARRRSPATVPEPPTGAQYELRAGDSERRRDRGRGGLRSWRVEARSCSTPSPPTSPTTPIAGKVLAPWPNRIRDGRYAFAGIEYRMPITEPSARQRAARARRCRVNWRPLRRTADQVTLGYVLHPQPGYPFTLALEVEYPLTADGITVTLRATNVGAATAPFGAGLHPYLTLGGERIDDAVLELPADARCRSTTGCCRTAPPVRRRHASTTSARAPVGTLELDTCFGDLERDADGLARVRLTAARRRRAV